MSRELKNAKNVSNSKIKSVNNEIFFLEKGKVSIDGIFNILKEELSFQYVSFFKREVYRIDLNDFSLYPVIEDMVHTVKINYKKLPLNYLNIAI